MASSEGLKLSEKFVKRIHTCFVCGWYRNVVVDPQLKNGTYQHREYGVVSYEEGAKRDVANHNCDAHRYTLFKLDKALQDVGQERRRNYL